MLPDYAQEDAPNLQARLKGWADAVWRLLIVTGFLCVGLITSVVALQLPIVTIGLCVFILVGALAGASGLSIRTRISPVAIGSTVVFIAITGTSMLWTPNLEEAQEQLVQFCYTLGPLALTIGVIASMGPALIRRFQWAYIIGVLIGVALLVFEVKQGQIIHRAVAGLKPDEVLSINEFNMALVGMAVLIFPTVGMLVARGQSNLAVVLPVAFAALLPLTESQTALLAMAAGLLVYALAWKAEAAMLWFCRVTVVALSLLAVPIAWGLSAMGLARMEWLMLSARHRVEVWKFAADRIAQNPWQGYGLQSSDKTFPRAGDISSFLPHDLNMVHHHPHNLFLQIWYEFGVPGAVFVAVLGCLMLWRLTRWPKLARVTGLATFITCICVVAVTSFSIWHTWFICSLALALLGTLLVAAERPEVPVAVRPEPAQSEAKEETGEALP